MTVERPLLVKIILLCSLMLSLTVKAEPAGLDFDPDQLSQSTVKVLIKTGNRITSSATGFVWKNNRQIVTSLHVMSAAPNTKVIVEFERKRRLATIKKILPNADLVLLEVSNPIKSWLPLTAYNQQKPKYRAEVAALGFNRGSNGMSTRELRKGYINPETLKALLPPNAVRKLKQSKLIDLDLPVYYLDGSLLPGYSGAPVVDIQGKLIGIGNGGLENGAASVSWVIPAHQLDNLENSQTNTLPASFSLVNQTFTGDNEQHQINFSLNDPHPNDQKQTGFEALQRIASIYHLTTGFMASEAKRNIVFQANSILSPLMDSAEKIASSLILVTQGLDDLSNTPLNLSTTSLLSFKNTDTTPVRNSLSNKSGTQDSNEIAAAEHKEVKYDHFLFIKKKSRNLEQMLASSSNPAGIDNVYQIHRSFFQGYTIDHSDFTFDIYEDSKTGLNIALPHGVELTVDRGRYLLAEGEMFCQTCPYEIQYHVRKLTHKNINDITNSPKRFLENIAIDHLDDLLIEGDGYGEYTKSRVIESYGNHRYVLRALFFDFQSRHKDSNELNYFTAATSQDAWFQAQGILNRFDQSFFELLNKNRGTDCGKTNLTNDQTTVCNELTIMSKILMSVHLTSFSNKLIQES